MGWRSKRARQSRAGVSSGHDPQAVARLAPGPPGGPQRAKSKAARAWGEHGSDKVARGCDFDVMMGAVGQASAAAFAPCPACSGALPLRKDKKPKRDAAAGDGLGGQALQAPARHDADAQPRPRLPRHGRLALPRTERRDLPAAGRGAGRRAGERHPRAWPATAPSSRVVVRGENASGDEAS
jgi:hypothetical protein